MHSKRCIRCSEVLAVDKFYRHDKMRDGHLNKCIECCKVEASRVGKSEKGRERDRVRNKDPARIAASITRNRRYRRENPEKARAHNAVSKAVMRGKLSRQPCAVCGAENSHAHHEDYSKVLDVVWLCPTHHAERHFGNEETTHHAKRPERIARPRR